MLEHHELLELKRWNTPTVFNGWEQITKRNPSTDAFNLEETRDFMPQMGPMVGYALTVVFEPSNSAHRSPAAWSAYRRFVAEMPGPKIVVLQDLDKPRTVGAFWGEVNSNVHRALGCVGTITDGAIRDVDEMTNAGFKALARRLCVGNAFSTPVQWGVPVEVFGRRVEQGQLIHADKHGFLAVNPDEEKALLAAARFVDSNECRTLIPAARGSAGKALHEVCKAVDQASAQYRDNLKARTNRQGEW
jgi:regulator of RNase E activity RraA